MLTIKKEMSMYDFIEEYSGLDNTDFANEHQALGIIYDSLYSMYGEIEDGFITDYIRFKVQEMDANYFIDQYSHIMDLEEDATDDEKHEAIENCLNDYTFYIGNYEHDGVMYYLFDEF